MKNLNARHIVAITVTGIFVIVNSSAVHAAKGVKKNADPNTPRIVTGQLLNVKYNNDGTGSVFLKTSGSSNNGNGGNTNSQEFFATPATSLVNYNGSASNPSQLKKGVRVRLLATGNNTSDIQILTQPRFRASFARMRTNSYRPYLGTGMNLHPNHHSHHHK